jgi:acetyl/propionyl-CoA carboxylase alpha subunit
VRYANLGTFEFLINARGGEAFAFIEGNPRLQVEHTVTEEVTGIDLVKTQLELASGKTLEELGLTQSEIPAPRGHAIQLRINMETMGEDGSVKPAGGTLRVFEPPSGPGIRVDSYAYAGYTTNPNFDSLLAKIIAYSPSAKFAAAAARAYRALCELRIEGVAVNTAFLQSLLRHDQFASNEIHIRFLEQHGAELSIANGNHQKLFFERPEESQGPGGAAKGRLAGAQIKSWQSRRAGGERPDRIRHPRREPIAPRYLGDHGSGRNARRKCADPGDDYLDRCRGRVRSRGGPATLHNGSDEDGARHQSAARGHRPADQRECA